jgi:stringent starvation protein B
VKSNRPYLIRAFYDWIVDNDMTPCILVDAASEGVSVPQSYVHDGRIVLNVGPMAVDALSLDNDCIRFSARFAAQAFDIRCPPASVLAIYARENGRGMSFGAEDTPEPTDPDPPPDPPPEKPGPRKGPSLRVVK